MPRVSRVVLCLLVVLGVGSSVVAWEDRVEATVAPAEIVAQIDHRAPAPTPIARAELAPPQPRPLSIGIAAPAPAPALALAPISLAPKTSPPRC